MNNLGLLKGHLGLVDRHPVSYIDVRQSSHLLIKLPTLGNF